ncbi:MAG: lipocalin-like domain-containing protein [Herpetosiphon sp.]
MQAVNSDITGFKRVTEPRTFGFPEDHGPHPGYQTEWWYYTGNLDSNDGGHWGYQLTFFRRQLVAEPVTRPSDFGTTSIYLAHFAVTDVTGKQFYAFDRLSRDGDGLAGAASDPFRVWLQHWQVTGFNDTMHLEADQDGVEINLHLSSTKPPVLQGDHGISQKSAEVGNASYYYSLTHMTTAGTIRAKGQAVSVSGLSWMDREWSTSALGPQTAGWNWFALQLSDGREIMLYQLRRRDGSIDPLSGGTIIESDGHSQTFRNDEATIDVTDHWRSSKSGADYPAGWHLKVATAGIDLTIHPWIPNQELPLAIVYWEGASKLSGTSNGQPVSGNGYVELTGYTAQQPAAVQIR